MRYSILFIRKSFRVRRIKLKADVINFQSERSIDFISCSNSKTSDSWERYRFLSVLNTTFTSQVEFWEWYLGKKENTSIMHCWRRYNFGQYFGNLPMRTTSSKKGKMELVMPINIKVPCRTQGNHVRATITPNPHYEMGVRTPVMERITFKWLCRTNWFHVAVASFFNFTISDQLCWKITSKETLAYRTHC